MRAPDFPERVVLDVELLDNLYIRNADYGVVALNTNYLLNELASYQTLKSGNSVAIFNALYRNYSFRDIKSPWWSEVSDAVKAIPLYRMAEKGLREDGYPMGPIFPEEGSSIAEQFPKALAYADTDSSRWFVSDIKSEVRPTYALASLVQLANYKDDDWAFYIELNRMIKDKISIDHSTSTYFFKALCDYFKEDFSPFFEHWGYSLTDEARSYASKYPLMDKAIWNTRLWQKIHQVVWLISQVTGITTVIIELTGRFMHWMQMEAITLIQGSRRTDCWTATNQQDGLHITTTIQVLRHFRIICLLI